jgi:hypothetical protein
VLWSGPQGGGSSARQLQQFLADRNLPLIPAQEGQVLDLGEDASLEVLSVGQRGAVLLLRWKRFSVLLPIGLEFESMEKLQKEPRLTLVTALMLADSGYGPLNPPEWVKRWNPQVVLLSVAAGDREGRPDPQVLEALEGYNLLRTDRNGWIKLSTDGEQLWMEVERK